MFIVMEIVFVWTDAVSPALDAKRVGSRPKNFQDRINGKVGGNKAESVSIGSVRNS